VCRPAGFRRHLFSRSSPEEIEMRFGTDRTEIKYSNEQFAQQNETVLEN